MPKAYKSMTLQELLGGGGNKEKGSDLGSKYKPRCDSIKYDVQDRRFAYQFGRFLVQTKGVSPLLSFIG